MDKLLEVTDIKNEPTDSTSNDRVKISSEMQVRSIKQESDCLIKSEINIKTEPQEDEVEFRVIASTSCYISPSYDMKIETDESMIKIECGNPVDELIQDPLEIGSGIKVEKQFSIDLEQGESRIKTELTEEKCENFLESGKNYDSDGSESNQSQNQLLIRNNINRKNKKYVCHVCNKTFKHKHVLDNHLRIHTGEKPYSCETCKKAFNRKGTRDTHMLIHSGEKPHKCNVCKKVFGQKSNLSKHKLIHSGAKPFSCDSCDKTFTQKQNLVTHIRIHTGEKPHACNVCEKAFAQKADLTKHIRTHTGEKPFFCDICNKSFADKSTINKHKKNHKK